MFYYFFLFVGLDAGGDRGEAGETLKKGAVFPLPEEWLFMEQKDLASSSSSSSSAAAAADASSLSPPPSHEDLLDGVLSAPASEEDELFAAEDEGAVDDYSDGEGAPVQEDGAVEVQTSQSASSSEEEKSGALEVKVTNSLKQSLHWKETTVRMSEECRKNRADLNSVKSATFMNRNIRTLTEITEAGAFNLVWPAALT